MMKALHHEERELQVCVRLQSVSFLSLYNTCFIASCIKKVRKVGIDGDDLCVMVQAI